jgi:hypothetical protein
VTRNGAKLSNVADNGIRSPRMADRSEADVSTGKGVKPDSSVGKGHCEHCEDHHVRLTAIETAMGIKSKEKPKERRRH